MNPRAQFAARLATGPPLLMAILDCGGVDDPVREAEALVGAQVDCIQLRAKAMRAGPLVGLARRVLDLTRPRAIPLIINDRVDVAGLVSADGVHVGAADLSPGAARRLLGEGAIVGLTVHDDAEVVAADRAADYLGAGAAFGSPTKPAAGIWGVQGLTAAGGLTTLPLIAVGGITPDNVGALRESGVAGFAAASALVPVSLHPEAVSRFRAALARW